MVESPLRDLARQLRNTARAHLAYSQVAEFMNHVDNHLAALAYAEENARAVSNLENQIEAMQLEHDRTHEHE